MIYVGRICSCLYIQGYIQGYTVQVIGQMALHGQMRRLG